MEYLNSIHEALKLWLKVSEKKFQALIDGFIVLKSIIISFLAIVAEYGVPITQ